VTGAAIAGAVNSGTTLPYTLVPGITDLDGTARVKGGAPDMGADEQ
jgi:hypothetical protein